MDDPDASRSGSAAGSGPQPLAPALGQAVRETDASVGLVYLPSPGEDVLRLAMVTGAPAHLSAPWARLSLTVPNPVSDAVRARSEWVGSQEELARDYPRVALGLPHPFALAVAPMTVESAARGALGLLWPGSHPPRLSAREREAVGAACERMGVLLHRADRAGRPISLDNAPPATAPPRTHGTEPVQAPAAEGFVDRLPMGCCALDPGGRITFVDATAAGLVDSSVPDLTGALLWEALPWLEDPGFEDKYRAAVVGRRLTSATVLCPPDRRLDIQLHPDASGVSLCVTPAHDSRAEERSEQAAQRTKDSAPNRAGSLFDLMHLAAALTEAVGVQDVVELAADQIMPAFGAQGFVVSVAEGGRLRIVGHRGYSSEVMDRLDLPSLRDDGAPTVRALTTGVPLFVASPGEMEQLNAEIPELTKKGSWAFLPLIASGRPVGCCVMSFDVTHPFSPDERAVLTSLAGLLAQALDRALLYDAEHQLAHGLQTGLLPATLPDVPGLEVAARYLPTARGMDIGGDFYDLIRLDDDSVAAAIGDVQGHSVRAAALMGQVRTAVHATAGASPAEVLARTNRLLTDFDPGLFASCLYAHLDLAHRRAHLASAGHLPPLLRHPDGSTKILDIPGGLLLGIDASAEYETTEVTLPPGSVLALYTDGLIEIPGGDLEDAAVGLAEQLGRSGDQPMDALADTLIRHHARTYAPSDDIALLLLRLRSADG